MGAVWAVLLALLLPVLHGGVTVEEARLPTARSGPAAVWADGKAYVFGGHDGRGHVDEVLAYDPARGRLTLAGRLPEPLFTAAAVWTGEAAYVFGGSADGGGTGLTAIVRFDPRTGEAVRVADLPEPTMAASAAWDPRPTPACPEGCAYVFGGSSTLRTYSRDVVRFDPSTHTVTPLGAVLPRAHRLAAAVWVGDHAYVFGGYDGVPLAQVVRYDPATNEATSLAPLPSARYGLGAALTTAGVRLLGGSDDATDLPDVLAFDPATGASRRTSAQYPCGLADAAWTSDGRLVYAFGGREGGPTGRNVGAIQVYEPHGLPRPAAKARC